MANATPTRATLTELSRTGGGITDLSDHACRRHIRAHGLKKDAAGKYDVKAVLNAILEDQKRDKRTLESSGGAAGLKTQVQVKEIALRCQKLEIEIATMKRERIPEEEVRRMLEEILKLLKKLSRRIK